MSVPTSRIARALGVAALVLVTGSSDADAPAGHFAVGTGATAGTVYDTKTQLTWQQTVSSTTYTWGSASAAGTAQNYCASLALAGGSWRLPTVNELASLVDDSVPASSTGPAVPTIDATAFPATPTTNYLYWSSTAVAGQTSAAWFVAFNHGTTSNTSASFSASVRCVH